MDVKVRYKLDKATSQKIFGELETEVVATLKNAEEIAKRTEGGVYFEKEEGRLWNILEYKSDYYRVHEKIKEEILNLILKKAESGLKEFEIDVKEELNWEEIEKVVKEIEEKKTKEKKEEERKEKAKQKIKNFIEKFNDEHENIKIIDMFEFDKILKLKIAVNNEVSATVSIYYNDIDESFTYERFVALVYDRVIQNYKELAKLSEEKAKKLEEQIELLREFIIERCYAKELIDFIKKKQEHEIEEEARELAEELVPELFENNDDETRW